MVKIQGGATTNLAEVDSNKNLKVNTFTNTSLTLLGTYGFTTTIAAVGGRIDVRGYKYMKVFLSGTMTTNNKSAALYVSGSGSVGGDLYAFQIADLTTSLTVSMQPSGVYATSIGNTTSASTGTDYNVRSAKTIPLTGLSEIQLYAAHGDTGTINFTINYILFNN